MTQKATKKFYQTLSELLDHPDVWSIVNPTMEISSRVWPNGLELWVGNGFWFFHVYSPTRIQFGLFQRWKLWRKVCNVRRYYELKTERLLQETAEDLLEETLARVGGEKETHEY